MQYFTQFSLFLIFFILLAVASKSYSNCGTLSTATIEWTIESSVVIDMRINFTTGGNVGWVAIGLNSGTSTMPGASIIMAFGSKVNDYRADGFSQPSLVAKRIQGEATESRGNGLSVSFTRPLSDGADSNYFRITDTNVNVLLAWNEFSTPSSPSSWSKHSNYAVKPMNFFTAAPCATGPVPGPQPNPGPTPPVVDLFPFHYIVLASIVIVTSLIVFPLYYFMDTVPGVDIFLHFKLIPFVNVKYIGPFLNELNLSLGELILIPLWIVINFAWVFVPAWNLSIRGLDPLNIAGRVFGQLNLLNFTLIMLPVTRHSIWVWIFGIPFERALKYHRWIGFWTYFTLCVHFILMATYNGVRGAATYPWSTNYTTTTSGAYGFVLAGFIAWCLMTLMIIMTFVRRWVWELFQISHLILGCLVISAASVHHYHVLLHMGIPIILWVVDIIFRILGLARPIKVESYKVIEDCTILELKSTPNLWFKPGQYVFVWIANVSPIEFHPFSVSNSPNSDGKFTLHIKEMKGYLSWTTRLKNLASNGGLENALVRIEGPYGNPSIKFDNYPVLYLIGGGIGITPLMSILTHYDRLITEGKTKILKTIVLSWCIRDGTSLGWFKDIMIAVASTSHVKISIHMTGKGVDSVIPTNLQNIDISLGRANYDSLFDKMEIDSKYKYSGVFACGPAQLISTVQAVCVRRSRGLNRQYHFHTETFAL